MKRYDYKFASYENYDDFEKCVILRHDIDNSINDALSLAGIESDLGVSSTYFVLMTSDFYNPFSKDSINKMKEIIRMGHKIGLHFDEANYDKEYYNSNNGFCGVVENEAHLLEVALGSSIQAVSMHRPSVETLEANYKFHNLINSYGDEFFNKFKYISDSRRCWHEDVDSIISTGKYDKLHILTHAIWYHTVEEDAHSTVYNYVNNANKERYLILKENISSLNEIMPWSEVR